jgi:hypothetical protein
MSNLSDTIAAGLIHNYHDFGRRVRSLAEPLTEEQFWIKPHPYGNSFGNLVLHLTGNLNYYIGTHIAGTGYVRQRELEFTENHIGQKEDVLRRLDAAKEMVIETLRKQSDADWQRAYTGVGADDVKDRFGIYLRCAVHFHHHIGQMIYLAKELAKAG